MISPRKEVSKVMRERIAFIPPLVEREQILSNCREATTLRTSLPLRSRAVGGHAQPYLTIYRGVGRGCGVGRGLGVTLGVALGVGVGVTVGVILGVAVGVELGVGVVLGEGVGVGDGGGPPGNAKA